MDGEEKKDIKPRVYRREEHSISRQNIDPDALKTMRRLMRHGYKAYLVGGGVRDLLLGKKPKDFDIATDATPRRIKALFRNCRIIGRRFKLAHVFFGSGKILEVSTFRAGQEAEAEPENERDLLITRDNIYGDEQSDALRRDITINALFYALRNFSVIDYIGGMEDLRAGIVRAIGDPNLRFPEDPVRMIRVVRHAVRAGFDIEDSCRRAILQHHSLIEKCSEMRLYEELKKDLTSGYALEILQELAAHNLLQHLLPELVEHDARLLHGRSLFARCLNNADAIALQTGIESVTPILTLIALFLGIPDPTQPDLPIRFDGGRTAAEFTDECFMKLAVPRKERERISHLLELWQYISETPAEDLNSRKLTKDPCFPDLRLLFRFLAKDGSPLEMLTSDQHTKRPSRRERQRRTRRRPPGNQPLRRML